MINTWVGLLFPLWMALLLEPTKEVKKTQEKKKPRIETIKSVEGDSIIKIKTETP